MVTVLIVGTRNVAEEQKMKCNSLFVEHVSGCTDEWEDMLSRIVTHESWVQQSMFYLLHRNVKSVACTWWDAAGGEYHTPNISFHPAYLVLFVLFSHD